MKGLVERLGIGIVSLGLAGSVYGGEIVSVEGNYVGQNFQEEISFKNFKYYFGKKRLDSLLETKKIDVEKLKQSWNELSEDKRESLQTLYSNPKKFLEILKKKKPKVFEKFEDFEKIYQRDMGSASDEQKKLLNKVINSKKSGRIIPYDLDMSNLSDRIYLSIENSKKK